MKRRRRGRGRVPCPCGSGGRYEACCQPWHDGAPAPTPEALMRSRYSAYALGLVGYIVRTTHPEGPIFREDTGAWSGELRRFCKNTRFLGLEVLEVEGPEEGAGHVTFRATMTQYGMDASMTERSCFEQVDGAWLYVSGEPW